MHDDELAGKNIDQRIRDEVAQAVELSAQLVALLARCRRTLIDARAVLASVERRNAIEDHPEGHCWLDPKFEKTG